MNEHKPKELQSGQLVESVSPVAQVLADTTYWQFGPYTFAGQTQVAPVHVPPFWQFILEQVEILDVVVADVVTAAAVVENVVEVTSWVHCNPVNPPFCMN